MRAAREHIIVGFGLLGLGLAGCSGTGAQKSSAEARGALSATPSGAGRVEPRGLGGGGALYAPSLSPHADGDLFIATDMTAVFRSRDFGRSWSMLPFQALQGGTMSQVRYTENPHVLYALNHTSPQRYAPDLISVQRMLAKSIDGGLTWSAPVDHPGRPYKGVFLSADPRRQDRVLYSDDEHLFFSGDGAQSFHEIHRGAWQDGLVVGGAYWDTRDIMVATSDGMLVSQDGGESFVIDHGFQGIPQNEKIVSFAGARKGNSTRFFAVTFEASDGGVTPDLTGGALDRFAGLYRLDWPSRQWQRISIDPLHRVSMVAMSPREPDIAYVGGGERHDDSSKNAPIVLKTRDGGRSWQSVFQTAHNANVATGWSGAGGDQSWEYGEYALGLAVSPRDPDRVAMSDLGFLHVSADGGASWQQTYVRPEDQNPAGADTPTSRAYVTSGLDPTTGWWMTFVDSKTLFASMTDVRSARSTDGGQAWSTDRRNGLSLNTTYHAVMHPGTGALYAATASVHDLYESPYLRDSRIDSGKGAVMVSTDKGATWTQLHDFRHPVVWLALDGSDPSALYASVAHSIDGGIYRIDLAHPSAAPVALPKPPRTKGHAFNVVVLDDGALVATYSGHQDGNGRVFQPRAGVFYLPKGASAWEDRSDPAMHYWTKDIVVDPTDASQETWYATVFSHNGLPGQAGTSGGLYRTRDRGVTWTRINDQFRVESCAIDPADPQHLYLSTEREGLWETHNLAAITPHFERVDEYPFRNPTRMFWNPFNPDEVWVMSFGGGVHVMTRQTARTGAGR
jgi:hypothetical protein